jgi:hypothetical protein
LASLSWLRFQARGLSIHYSVGLMIHFYPQGKVTGMKSSFLLPFLCAVLTAPFSFNVSYPVYKGASYDASVTNLTYLIPETATSDTLEIELSFLSPITPTSTLRQSIPASYLTVTVSGTTDVNVYIDLNGQWVSGDRSSRVVWDLDHLHSQQGQKRGLKKWHVRRETELLLSEIRDRAEWGTLHFVGPEVSNRHEIKKRSAN